MLQALLSAPWSTWEPILTFVVLALEGYIVWWVARWSKWLETQNAHLTQQLNNAHTQYGRLEGQLEVLRAHKQQPEKTQ